MNQVVNLESTGEITFTAKYKSIWYKRDTEIFHENDLVKSYKIELYFGNGKSMKDYVALPKEINPIFELEQKLYYHLSKIHLVISILLPGVLRE